MKSTKLSVAISCLLMLAVCDQLGEVYEGNYNEGVGNTILSTGNFVKGDGNIVAPLDSSLDIFGGDPFFSSNDLFDPVTVTQKETETITSPIYPGPIPAAVTTQQTTTTSTVTPAETTTTDAATTQTVQPTETTTETKTQTKTVETKGTATEIAPTTSATATQTTTTTTTTGTIETKREGQTKVSSTKAEGYLYAGLIGVITTIIIAS